jgi:hypothetical protein
LRWQSTHASPEAGFFSSAHRADAVTAVSEMAMTRQRGSLSVRGVRVGRSMMAMWLGRFDAVNGPPAGSSVVDAAGRCPHSQLARSGRVRYDLRGDVGVDRAAGRVLLAGLCAEDD